MSTRHVKPIPEKRLKAYMETYPKFKYESPFAILKDNFNTLDFN
jgi:hypothetical protein